MTNLNASICRIALASVLALLPLPSQGKALSSCYETALQERPLWVSGAAWLNSSELMVVDPMQNKLLVYGLDGSSRPSPSPVNPAHEFLPTAVASTEGGGFLVELADGSWMQVDKNLKVQEEGTFLPREKSARGFQVGSVFQWNIFGNTMVAYGSLIKGDQTAFGFFRLRTGGPENPAPLILDDDRSFYLIGNNYITSIGATAYFVVMDKHPMIFKAVPGQKVQALSAFPEEFRNRPDFKTRMAGPNSAAAHFGELESFTIASGLYAQDGNLFLLTRKPESPGRTAWFLYKIDPVKDKLMGSLRLPTSANHLTVVPGKDAWAFIERGPVQALQRQTIDKMIMIPSSVITTLGSLPKVCPAK